jgi:predicted dehydrogenase
MLDSMQVLVVGTGSIGRRHISNLRLLVPDLAVDVLREGSRATATDSIGDASISTTLEAAMDKRPDLMVIANPSALHLRYLMAAIDCGIPFYAEKPVVSGAEDYLELRQKVQSTKVPPNIVGCNMRFLPSLKCLRDLIQSGRLGRLVHASFEAGQWLPDWRPQQDYRQSYSARAALGGGVALDLIHEVDAARWLLGEFEQVAALLNRGSSLEIETEDTASLLLRSCLGVPATVQLDYVSRRPFRRYRIVGDMGTAEWDLPSRTLTVASSTGVETLALDSTAFDVGATYLAAMQDLLDAIENGRPSAQPIEEGLATLDLVLRAKAQQTQFQ